MGSLIASIRHRLGLLKAAYSNRCAKRPTKLCNTYGAQLQSVPRLGPSTWISLLFLKSSRYFCCFAFCGHTFVDFSIKRSADLDTSWLAIEFMLTRFNLNISRFILLFGLNSPERKENIWKDSLVNY